MKTKKRPSGAQKLKAAGKRAILLGVHPEQHALLTSAAEKEGRAVSNFVLFHALKVAEAWHTDREAEVVTGGTGRRRAKAAAAAASR